jgi:hypothetical protein
MVEESIMPNEECGVVGVRHLVPVGDAMSKKGVAGG